MEMITGKKRKEGNIGADTINMEQEKRKEGDKYKLNTSRRAQTRNHGYYNNLRMWEKYR